MPAAKEAKSECYTFAQIKEIMQKNEETIIKCFNATIERMEAKIESLCIENKTLKEELHEVRKSIEFSNEIFEGKIKEARTMKEDDLIMDKLAELEDRSRRNNLRIEGIEEEEGETWETSEEKVLSLIKKLGIKSRVQIERVHRTGRKVHQRNRTIVAKFNNYKDEMQVMSKYKELKYWEQNIFINEDFSERTVQKRKELFKEARELRREGRFAKVIYRSY